MRPQEDVPPPRPSPPENLGRPFDPNDTSGRQTNVDPNSLRSGQQRSLDPNQLETQRELIRTGTPRRHPIMVDQNGVIYDGHHGVRAAIEAGVPVNIEIVPNLVSPGKIPVIDIPYR